MDLYIYESTIQGFRDGEFDLAALFNRVPSEREKFINEIIKPIVQVLRTPNVGAALTVAGHADRYDVINDHKQCLPVERTASEKRLTSALAQIHYLVKQREPSAPADLNTLAYFDVNQRAAGASNLESPNPASETERLKNRRIQARLLVYIP